MIGVAIVETLGVERIRSLFNSFTSQIFSASWINVQTIQGFLKRLFTLIAALQKALINRKDKVRRNTKQSFHLLS